MGTDKKIRLSRKEIILIAVILALDLVLSVASYGYLSRSLFLERSSTTSRLVAQITQNVDMGIQSRCHSVEFLANQFADESYETLEDAQKLLGKMKCYRTDMVKGLFFIDREGLCYTSQGDTYQWLHHQLLFSDENEVFISSSDMPELGITGPRMYFLTRLPQAVTVEEVTITHMCMACDVSFVDPFFDTTEFGEDSVAFIIRKDGTQLYQRGSESALSGAYNLLATLARMEFSYDGSFEDLQWDIQAGNSGCMRMLYKDEPHYIAYHPMPTNQWTAVLLIPENEVGPASAVFLRSVILSILLIGIGALILLAVIFLTSSHVINQKQDAMNMQLRKAVEAERSANAAKTQFLSSMSHDIRTPMNAIIGMTELASTHLEDPVYVKNCLNKVTLASNHLLTLINDVLDISKVESGKTTLNPGVFSVADTAHSIVSILRPQIRERKMQFSMRTRGIRWEHLYADELRINQVLINILTNAVKYTPEGGKIDVELLQEPADREGWVKMTYSVQDNGIGMTREFQKTMYDAFTRANDEKSPTAQGTGLGLAICKQMVDLMGGTIRCESALGRGTKFTVVLTLPLAEGYGETPKLPPQNVLLADGDEAFLDCAGEILRQLGLMVLRVSTGGAAVRALEEGRRTGREFSLVILGGRMVDKTAIETAREIRALGWETGPKILISAYDDIEDAARAAGADGIIAKPFFPSTVSQRLKLLAGETSGQTQESSFPEKSFEGMRLLVAEDNDLNWEIASELLGMYGIAAERAENGMVCVNKLNEADAGQYDMVLMDIQMPILNGYGAARAIRGSQKDWVKNIPIVAMTADAFADDVQKCMDAGMNAHIAKPIQIKHVLATLDKLRTNN